MEQMKFTEEQIPYHILQGFGLSKEMIEDLPEEQLKKLLQGKKTAVLPVHVKTENGDEVHSAARISLINDDKGNVRVLFYPKLLYSNLSKFTDEQQKALNAGNPIVENITTREGKKTAAFHQIDPATGQVISVPLAVLGNNLQVIAEELRLTSSEINCITKGKLLSVHHSDDTQVTVGVSLKERSGFRVVDGDESVWREQEKKDYAHYSFGLNGCWVSAVEDNLEYIPEDEYTEDMWDEMKKRSNLQRNASTHKV